jgi:hypothetical protein
VIDASFSPSVQREQFMTEKDTPSAPPEAKKREYEPPRVQKRQSMMNVTLYSGSALGVVNGGGGPRAQSRQRRQG